MASLIQYDANDAIPPANAIELGSQTDSGRMWSVIANTPYGKLPGKASYSGIHFACWYSYGGSEHQTDDFSWIVTSLEKRLVSNRGSFIPPKNALHITGPNDEFAYCIIAKTEWGRIPGRSNLKTAWFPYGGIEHETSEFFWVVIGSKTVSLVPFDLSDPIPPSNSIEFGSQGDDFKRVWSVIADTDYGLLPAKAAHKGGQFTCWYSYDGLEFETDKFSWIVTDYEKKLVNNDGDFDPPTNALLATLLHDKNGPYYSIIANTEWGKIPGRANNRDAWFSYGGREHNTQDFDWIVVDPRSVP